MRLSARKGSLARGWTAAKSHCTAAGSLRLQWVWTSCGWKDRAAQASFQRTCTTPHDPPSCCAPPLLPRRCNTTNPRAPGTGCYPKAIAHILPSRFFTCDKFLPPPSPPPSPDGGGAAAVASSYDCFGKKGEGDCEGADGCTW